MSSFFVEFLDDRWSRFASQASFFEFFDLGDLVVAVRVCSFDTQRALDGYFPVAERRVVEDITLLVLSERRVVEDITLLVLSEREERPADAFDCKFFLSERGISPGSVGF